MGEVRNMTQFFWGLVWPWCLHRPLSTAAIPCHHQPRRGLDGSWQGQTVWDGGREVRGSRPGGEGSRPLGKRSRLGKRVRGEMRSGLRERWDLGGQRRMYWALHLSCCVAICSPSTASIYLSLYVCFLHPPAPGLCRMQAEGASGVEVLLAFGPPLLE